MSSRELKDYEAELLETKVIGKDAVAIVINEENPLENLTIKQLTDLYNGTYKNWDDISWEKSCPLNVCKGYAYKIKNLNKILAKEK